MHKAVMDALPSQQIVIKAAAVADFTPVSVADSKIKKRDEMTLALQKAPDILADIGASSPRPFIVAFAAETDDLESNAREKLVRKNADLIVANDVADASIGFDSDQNAVTVIARDGSSTKIERAPKIVIANRILDLVVERLGS
jgi:phosphopantothenoylcysteine decarboxylase/phosphopantothenate--cysteine ligase